MRTRIIRIGNSLGIRIPKVMLEQSRLGPEVELEVAGGTIVIRPVVGARQGWDEQFRRMAACGDLMTDGDLSEAGVWDRDEWAW